MDHLCSDHFIAHAQHTVQHTIESYDLITQDDKVVVGLSGGKDSQVLLHILVALGYKPDALLIDEGIKGYREHTIEPSKRLCASLGVSLQIISYEYDHGSTLDNALKKKCLRPCSICGPWRRQSLNRHAKEYTKLAVGHNLDDECQAIVMNVLSGHQELLKRHGPINMSAKHTGLTPRIKPLYFLSERQIRLYAYLTHLHIYPGDCPYAPLSLRGRIRDWINEYEHTHPGTKKNIIDWFLDRRDRISLSPSHSIRSCLQCGEPSSQNICKSCKAKQTLGSHCS